MKGRGKSRMRALADVERASIIKPSCPAPIRAAVRMFEDSLGVSLEDFPA